MPSVACTKNLSIVIKTMNPFAWWPMEEAGGADRVDTVSSIHLHPFTLDVGTVSSGTGKVGNAVQFSFPGPSFGASAYVESNAAPAFQGVNTLPFQATGFSVTGWFQHVSGGTNAFPSLFNFRAFDPSNTVLLFQLKAAYDPSGPTITVTNTFGAGDGIIIAGPVAPGVFHLFRFNYDQTTGLFFFQLDNGVKNYSSVPLSLPASIYGSFIIGSDTGNVSTAVQRFDEVAIFQSAISDATADQIWNGGNGITWP